VSVPIHDLTALPPILMLLTGLGLGLFIALLVGLVWKARYTRLIRQDAVLRSQATIAGQVHEQLLPYFPDFPFNPKDARFLGSPIDLIIFDGLDAGQIEQIVLVEVKTGRSTLSKRERQIRDAIQAGRISWQELRVGS